MPILGGSKKHDWSVQELSKKDDTVHQHYHTTDDVAGQLLHEEAYKGYCELKPGYFDRNKKVSFIDKFKSFFSSKE